MQQIVIAETDARRGKRWTERVVAAETQNGEMKMVQVFAEEQEQTLRGFGGAFTEAAAHVYAGMDEEKRREIIDALYGREGLRYNLGRAAVHSCDFALGNYTYIEEGDAALATFSVAHDEREILPMIGDAQRVAAEEIVFLASPWSPPAFMKTNGEMNHGGKLKEEYADVWARYLVKFLLAYEERGVFFSCMTVQNEPGAAQEWDSCLYTAEEEARFVREHLYPALAEAGLAERIKIFVWDHNKELAYTRLKASLADAEAAKYIAGCAVHWYTGDHFESLNLIRKHFPDKEILFSEGCVEYSRLGDASEIGKAEMYAHDMIGNLNAGCSAVFDWNLLLDMDGGPNHAGNFCAAPIMADPAAGTWEKRLTYYYIGQFSRYLQRGAVHAATTRYTDEVETVGFVNPDGERVIVLLNRSDRDVPLTLRENGRGAEMTLHAHTIATCRYKEPDSVRSR